MKATSEMILREIAGEKILIPVGKTAMKIHGMINLSESGYLLWSRLQNECTEKELVDAILSEYDIDRQTAICDVRTFLDQMRSVGILEE